MILVSGFAALAWAVYGDPSVRRGMSIVIVVLALSQAIYQVQIYRIVGTPVPEAIARFGLDKADRTPLPLALTHDPYALNRKLCVLFAECYLSLRDTASLLLDREGTFLRNREEAVFQPGLAPPVAEALSAVGHPIFWTSRRAETYGDAAQLTKVLNDHASRIGRELHELVYVRRGDIARLGRVPADGPEPVLSDLWRGVDWLRLSFRAETPFYLNAAIAYDPHWRASAGDKHLAIVRGNFGGLALVVPAGSGTIELRYVNRWSQLLFASRIIMGLAGIAAVSRLTYAAIIGPFSKPRRIRRRTIERQPPAAQD
jgi:hypothetical protein